MPSSDRQTRNPRPGQPPESDFRARLRAEAKAPYRGLRHLIYLTFAGSGLIGAVVFLAQLAAGREIASAAPNFALQVGVVALMVWLFRIDRERQR